MRSISPRLLTVLKRPGMSSWYAIRVFFNRLETVESDLQQKGIETYVPRRVEKTREGARTKVVRKPIIPSIIFVHCNESEVIEYKRANNDKLMFYANRETRRPDPIREREMELFRIAVEAQDSGLEFIGEDRPEYHEGERVRVIDGVYKGTEGYIRRIKKDKRLLVCLSGVAVVATSYIPASFLEKA